MVSPRGPGARQGQLECLIPALLLRRPNGLPDPPPSWTNYILVFTIHIAARSRARYIANLNRLPSSVRLFLIAKCNVYLRVFSLRRSDGVPGGAAGPGRVA